MKLQARSQQKKLWQPANFCEQKHKRKQKGKNCPNEESICLKGGLIGTGGGREPQRFIFNSRQKLLTSNVIIIYAP